MKKRISIIIVTYNSEKHIFQCLDSVFKYNDIGDELEVIVVDNMSKEVDLMFNEISVKYNTSVKLIKNDKNGGYGQGNNIGIRQADGDIIMIMNPDVRLLHPIFKKAINHFQNQKTVMLGMLQMISETKRGWSFMSRFSLYPILEIFETSIANRLLCYNYKRMYFSGACFFIRKKEFEEIGLFNEDIFLYGEENDVHYRMRSLKPDLKLVFDKQMTYYHVIEERMPTVSSTLKTIDSIVETYVSRGFDRNAALKLQLKYEIKRTYFFKFLRWLRADYKFVNFYNELLKVLKDKVSNLPT